MTNKILVKMTDDYRLFDLRKELLKELKKEFNYLKWKTENDNINQINKEIN